MPWDMPIPHFSHGIEASFLSAPEKWLLAHWFGLDALQTGIAFRAPAAFEQLSSVMVDEAVVDLLLHAIPDRLLGWIQRHPEYTWQCLQNTIPASDTPDLLLGPQWSRMHLHPKGPDSGGQVDYLSCWVPEFDRFVVVSSGSESGLELPIGHFSSSLLMDRDRIARLIDLSAQ